MLTIDGFVEQFAELRNAYTWKVTKNVVGRWVLRAIYEDCTWDGKVIERCMCPLTAMMHSQIRTYIPSWEYARHSDRIGLKAEDAIVIACAADGYKVFSELAQRLREAVGVEIPGTQTCSLAALHMEGTESLGLQGGIQAIAG